MVVIKGCLDNSLVDNQTKRCVVLLNEFDKAKSSVQNALIKVMDDGTYGDRRGSLDFSELDCRKVVWLLASNYGDVAASRFYENHVAPYKPEGRVWYFH
ncbi:hypothetical protein GGR53DRAFT_468363 [Hypoxylon sp. FL1150]|nr:hypothetical protein GGR53DRAFT_468363 [Hypoxylon sp. FL1150]